MDSSLSFTSFRGAQNDCHCCGSSYPTSGGKAARYGHLAPGLTLELSTQAKTGLEWGTRRLAVEAGVDRADSSLSFTSFGSLRMTTHWCGSSYPTSGGKAARYGAPDLTLELPTQAKTGLEWGTRRLAVEAGADRMGSSLPFTSFWVVQNDYSLVWKLISHIWR